MQMLLACGAFVISEKITPNPILRPNIDYIEVSTPQELYNAVTYYLAHPEERNIISESAMERVRKTLDSKLVFSNLIYGISNGTVNGFITTKKKHSLDLLDFIIKAAKLLRRGIRSKFAL